METCLFYTAIFGFDFFILENPVNALTSLNFSISKQMVDGIITLSESEIISSMKMIFERMKIVVEPSSSIVLAAAIKRKEEFRGKKVGLILSGGNVDCDNFPWIN